MRARARSAKPRSGGSNSVPRSVTVPLLRRRRPELRAPRLDRPQPLRQAGPRPGLDLAVARLGLRPRRLEVLEPGVRLLDQQELFGFVIPSHSATSGVVMGGIVGPRSDGVR